MAVWFGNMLTGSENDIFVFCVCLKWSKPVISARKCAYTAAKTKCVLAE